MLVQWTTEIGLTHMSKTFWVYRITDSLINPILEYHGNTNKRHHCLTDCVGIILFIAKTNSEPAGEHKA